MIGQILEYNIVAEFLFMIQLVNLPPSAHTITFSAHCSKSLVHTAAHCNPLQPAATNPVHIQCTLRLYYPVHTAANLQCTLQQIFSAHCSYTIQCILQLHYLVPIPYSAHYIQCTSGPPKICNSPICYWWLVTA